MTMKFLLPQIISESMDLEIGDMVILSNDDKRSRMYDNRILSNDKMRCGNKYEAFNF